jgi:hypothetical protein
MTPTSARVAILLTMSLLSLLGCRVSTPELPGTPGEVRVTIEIEQRTDRQNEGRPPYEFNRVSVVLANKKGAAIEKPDVQVLMNGVPLSFGVSRGNYYDRHPSYSLADAERDTLRPDTDYAFTLVWPDGSKYDIATIHTPKRLELSQFTVAETHRAGSPLEIAWRDLAETCELVAYRGFEYPNENGDLTLEGGSVNSEDALRKTIGPGLLRSASSSMTVPSHYFAPDGTKRVASFGMEVSRVAEAKVSKPFPPESRARAVRTMTFRTEIPSGSAETP